MIAVPRVDDALSDCIHLCHRAKSKLHQTPQPIIDTTEEQVVAGWCEGLCCFRTRLAWRSSSLNFSRSSTCCAVGPRGGGGACGAQKL
jgi:hypothetical protein